MEGFEPDIQGCTSEGFIPQRWMGTLKMSPKPSYSSTDTRKTPIIPDFSNRDNSLSSVIIAGPIKQLSYTLEDY